MYKYFISKKPQPSKAGYEFQMLYTFDKRQAESKRMKSKYPDYIPVIIERSDASDVECLDKTKFLFKPDVTISNIIIMIRRKINLNDSESLILFINNINPPLNQDTIASIHDKHADKDGFLYITYAKEKTFG